MLLTQYLSDPNGLKSSGRLIAAYLVVIGVLAFPAGLILPHMAAYTASFTNQCFGYAAIFYGATKGYDTFNWVKGKLPQWLGTKDAGTPAEAPTPTTAPTEGES